MFKTKLMIRKTFFGCFSSVNKNSMRKNIYKNRKLFSTFNNNTEIENDVLNELWFAKQIEKDFSLNPPKRIAIAVSGGADSLALAMLAKKWSEKSNCYISAFVVDHKIRKESFEEANYTLSLLRNAEIRSEILSLNWKDDRAPTSSIQKKCRLARYKVLSDACDMQEIPVLVTGHHANDQAETFLMRLSRQSNLEGLASMRRVAPCVLDDKKVHPRLKLWRPALNISKFQLQQFCENHQLAWVNDPSNEDTSFRRVETRQLLSKLTQNSGFNATTISCLTERVAAQSDALHSHANQLLDSTILVDAQTPQTRQTFSARQVIQLPHIVRKRVLLELLARQGIARPSKGVLQSLTRSLQVLANKPTIRRTYKPITLPELSKFDILP